jgi:hypothetical protein
VAFRDGLGERHLIAEADGTTTELLCLRRELSAVPSFEFALRERASRLAHFQHSYFARVRGIDRSASFNHALTVVSDAIPGPRLSELLATAHDRGLPVPIGAALCLVRQLVPAVAILHETARDAAHGGLAPERLVLGPHNRLTIVEYVLGSALEQLLYSRERYWKELRVALPRVAGLPRFDHLADVTQIGAIALQLVAGRLLRDEEYPARVGEIVSTATAVSERAGIEPLAAPIKSWLTRALQLDPRHSFPSAIEARAELERAITESGYDASPEALEAFLARYHAPDPVATALTTPDAPAAVATEWIDIEPAERPSSAHTPAPGVHVPATRTHATTEHPVLLQPVAAPVLESLSVPPVATPPAALPPAARDPELPSPVERRRAKGRLVTAAAAIIVAGVVLTGGGLLGARRFLAKEPEAGGTGTLTLASNPAGAEAVVDGVRRGTTPVTLTLSVGPHRVELRGDAEPRVIPVTMTAGAQLTHYVDLPKPQPPLAVMPEPVAAPPVPVATTAVIPAPDDTLSLAGWIAVQMKSVNDRDRLDVDVYEGERLLGNSRFDRIMLPVGRHDLDFVNAAVGLRVKRTVQVAPGKVSSIAIDPPTGTIAMNALPWAEVWVDGNKIGETPIGNHQISIGPHAVVFRHPELGEREQTVLVTLTNPARISVDLRKP